MKNKQYIIKAINYKFEAKPISRRNTGVYWNNDDGWGDKKSATVFSEFERNKYNLPIGGKWVEKKD